MKSKISPTMIKRGSRCTFAAALSIMINPKTGFKYQEYHGEKTKDRMCEGIYFEEVLTGKTFVPFDGDGGFYEKWHGGVKDHTIRRIHWFADCARRYLVRNEAELIGWRHEVELPDFILGGEADYVGEILPDGGHPERAVADMKFSSDITRWDFDRAPKQQFLQSPIYSLVYALLKEGSDRSLFERAIAEAKLGNAEPAGELLAQWAATTEILPAAYLIAENRDVPEYMTRAGGFIKAEPHMRLIVLDMTPWDYVSLYFFIRDFDELVSELVMHGNYWDERIAARIGAGPAKCLGTNYQGEHPGRCPMLNVCAIGRVVTGGTQRIQLRELDEL
jgi:hypothetical protein